MSTKKWLLGAFGAVAVVAYVGYQTFPAHLCIRRDVQEGYKSDTFKGCLNGMFAEAIRNQNPEYIERLQRAAKWTGQTLELPKGVTASEVGVILGNPALRK